MSKKLLLISLSLFFTIGNATPNEQELKIEQELLKIKQEKEEFKKQCALIDRVWDNFAKEIDSFSHANHHLLKLGLRVSKPLLRQACMITLEEIDPNNKTKKEELLKQLADLQAQKVAQTQQDTE